MKTLPRLLLITKHLLDPRDAQAQQSAALVAALSTAGARVDVITGEVETGTIPISLSPTLNLYALPARWPTRRQNLAAKVTRKLQRNLAAWAPSHWAKEAARLASGLMAGERYDAVISVASPCVRKAPWIAYLSDPWPESILPAPYSDFAIPLLNGLQKQVVTDVFSTADALVFPCAEELDYLALHYPTLARNKAFVIPHVKTVETTAGYSHTGTSTHITVVHGGALSRERVCPGLAEALAALPASSRLRLRLIGHVHPDMLQALERTGAMPRVSIDGWKPKQETLGLLSSAEALLLLEAKMPAYPFLPSKLADYAATGRPIIAITGEGSPSARLIREHDAGLVAGHDFTSILQALQAMEAQYGSLSSHGLGKLFEADRIACSYYGIVDSLRARTMFSEAVPSP